MAATLSKARVAAGRGVDVGSVDAVEDTADDDDSVSASALASASPDDRPRNKYAPKGPSGSESSTEYSLSLLLSSDADR